MGFRFVGRDCPDRAYLLPPDVRDWLPSGHLARTLLEETGRMDLSAFTSWNRADGQGRPAYHPAVMVALIGYCYCKGIRSSRSRVQALAGALCVSHPVRRHRHHQQEPARPDDRTAQRPTP